MTCFVMEFLSAYILLLCLSAYILLLCLSAGYNLELIMLKFSNDQVLGCLIWFKLYFDVWISTL